MEVKPGYKRTDLGMLPDDWKCLPIGRIIAAGTSITYGIVQAGPHVEGGVPYIKTGEMTKDRLMIDSLARTSSDIAARFPRSTVRTDELIYSIRASVGAVHQVPPELDGANLTQGTARISPGANIDARFLLYALRSAPCQTWVSLRTKGTTYKEITLATLRELPVPLPPTKAEQGAISNTLSEVESLLDGLERLIAKKRDLKQAAMQQLLTGQIRLPGFHGKWEFKAIGDQIDLLTGFPFPSNQYSETGIRLLRGSNVKRGKTDWAEDLVQYWPSITPEIERYQLRSGDLVIAMDGSLVGRSYARLKHTDLPAVLLQRVARIRSKAIDLGFLTQVVGSERFIRYCDSVKTVTAIPHISSADIRGFKTSLPPTIVEQTAIAAVLSDMDDELAALEQRRDKTRALKQGMMQELLTGRTRLVPAGDAHA